MAKPEKYQPTSWFMAKAGKTQEAVWAQFKTHGVPMKKVGRLNHYHVERGLAAMELGKQLDKRNAAAELASMEAAGVDKENIVYKMKVAQLRKVELQCDQLRTELDKTRESLADVDEIANRYTRLLSDMAQRLSTWRESAIAKRPKLRKDIDECHAMLTASMELAGE